MAISESATDIHTPPRPGGKKEMAIIEAAVQVFMRNGYGRTSMDKIAREAGVAKQTIYQHFGSKQALFGAIVTERCHELMGSFDLDGGESADIGATLKSLARHFLTLVLSPSTLALHRVVIAEAAQFPEIGQVTYESGPRVGVARLSRFLSEQTRAGRLSVENPTLAAEQFFGQLLGHHQLKALLGVAPPPDSDEIEASVKTAVSGFLATYATSHQG